LKAQDVFESGSPIDVSGITKGRGFQGVMKRHGMSGTKASHGVHEYFRHGGSIGCRLTPGRVVKGKSMAGQMGATAKTVQGLQLVNILEDDNCILVRGPLPGATGDYLTVKAAATRDVYKRVGMGQEESRSKNPLKASKKAAAGR
ncbi:MAG: 50S ribosomal protein L3, partial [Deltaproteobacteria bacterium]|nr:50S ribosomal protein L3 [Deltaproteobacteria bacterium]